MTPKELIVDICKQHNLSFRLSQLDDLLIICHQYHLRVGELIPTEQELK